MKSYLSLVPISAKVHRHQSRMTRICIILAVFLVTSIFSMMEMWNESELTAMRRKHGDWHIALQNMSEKEAQQIIKSSDIAFSSWYDEINVDADQGYYINGKNVVLYGAEEKYVTDIMQYPAEGTYPQTESEVALSADAKQLLGVEIGDRVVLNTPEGNFEYTISGFYADDIEFNDMIQGCCAYMNKNAFNEICIRNKSETTSQFYIRFQKENGLKKTIANLKQQYNLTDENIEENTAILGLLGASNSETFNGLYPLAAVCLIIILAAGVLMVSGCMNSDVAQRTKFFGMMRCIGASKKQILHFVRLEALNWCKTAIPIGCVLGTVVCWILCAILRFFVKGEWADMPLFAISPSGILCGAVVGVVTVLLAAHSPAKQAAKVSPVAAVSGNTEEKKKILHAANTRLFKVETSLGVYHATETKKNLILMTGSFALTIVLFLTFSACLDVVNKLLPSAVSKFTPDITIASENDTNSINENLLKKINKIEGVDWVFGFGLYTAYPVELNGRESTIDLFSHDSMLLDQFKNSVVSGDIKKVYGNTNYAMAVYNQSNSLNVGDIIKIGDQEIEIACVTSEGIGNVSDAATVVCSEETFARLTGDSGFITMGVILKKDVSDASVQKIYDLANGYLISDNREANSETSGSYWVFRIAAYGFLTIISLITVLNIMNSISMGVSARLKQYGAMRAAGMESRQVRKMITAEAVTYAVCGTIAGIVLGLIIHYLIYKKIVITHFGGAWNIPFSTIGIVFLLVAFSCIIAVYGPSKRIKNMAITDTINNL